MVYRLMLKYGLDKDDIDFIKLGKTQSSHLLPSNISSNILRIIRGIQSRFCLVGLKMLLTQGLGAVYYWLSLFSHIFLAFHLQSPNCQ